MCIDIHDPRTSMRFIQVIVLYGQTNLWLDVAESRLGLEEWAFELLIRDVGNQITIQPEAG